MGCDIHAYAEKKNESGKFDQVKIDFFDRRSYGFFGWLAGVRNYSAIGPVVPPRGLPADMSEGVAKEWEIWDGDGHNASWLSIAELDAIDYDVEVEDRRGVRNGDGGHAVGSTEGEKQPLREFLGDWFFEEIVMLRAAGVTRIVFWFDN